MITPEKIIVWAERQYIPYLQSWLEGQLFQVLELPIGKLTNDYSTLRTEVQRLHERSREAIGYGYTVEYQEINKRQFGKQSIPSRILIDSERDLLRLLRKESEAGHFMQDITYIRNNLSQLELWLRSNIQRVIVYHGKWKELIAICQYFIDNPRPALYIRELPIPVHTKFIEENSAILRSLLDFLLPALAVQDDQHFERRYGLRYDEPLIRFRYLSPDERVKWTYTDLSVPFSQFAAHPIALEQCIITENKMTFLTLPESGNSFALFGGGFRVELLASVGWLHDRHIFYWGDLDAQGFQILSMLRANFPDAQSLMMDQETLTHFRGFAVPGTPSKIATLPYLTMQEYDLFVYLQENNLRLEQERISQEYVLQKLAHLG